MLTLLNIKNFIVIEHAELDFTSGMTVITGETGAGKSMLIQALALIIGERADSKMIRHQQAQAEISAQFNQLNIEAIHWLTEHAFLDTDADTCVIRRILSQHGSSKCFINGQICTLSQLKALGQFLMSIHGQHEHHALLKRQQQLYRLDHFAQHQVLCEQVKSFYSQIKTITSELEAQRAQQKQLAAQKDLLHYQTAELEELNLDAETIVNLGEEHKRLAHALEVQTGCQQLAYTLQEDEQALCQQLRYTIQQLSSLSQLDKSLQENLNLLEEAEINLQECAQNLQRHAEHNQPDPERLAEIDHKLKQLHDLARKHQVKPEQLPAHYQALCTELENLQDLDTQLAMFEKKLGAAKQQYAQATSQLTHSRQQAAQKLMPNMTNAMQELGMAGGLFAVKIYPLAKDEYSAEGAERIEFEVQTNPGQALAPLSAIASGGELSRISLAIQLLTAEHKTTPTLIFDEVDVGISGAVAERVGRLLRKLGQHCQVLCVTHLPQVAAQGHHHYHVQKSSQQQDTVSIARRLAAHERPQALASLLGGDELTDRTLAHAKEMLTKAQAKTE